MMMIYILEYSCSCRYYYYYYYYQQFVYIYMLSCSIRMLGGIYHCDCRSNTENVFEFLCITITRPSTLNLEDSKVLRISAPRTTY